MPYAFAGTLKKFGVVREPEKLSEADRQKLKEGLAKAMAGE